MSRGNSEAATVTPESTSVEIFDALAIYLAFSTQGLTTHTVTMDLRADGFSVIAPDDAEDLPCDTLLVPKLADADLANAALVNLAVAWQPGQLELFNAAMTARFLSGGRPCPS